jgi:hypothetical protein
VSRAIGALSLREIRVFAALYQDIRSLTVPAAAVYSRAKSLYLPPAVTVGRRVTETVASPWDWTLTVTERRPS